MRISSRSSTFCTCAPPHAENTLGGPSPLQAGGCGIPELSDASGFFFAALTCICGRVHRQWFMEVFLSLCTDFHDTLAPVFNAVLREGPRINMAFWPLSLAHRDFSTFSHSVLIILCKEWDIQGLRIQKHYSDIIPQFVHAVLCKVVSQSCYWPLSS